MGWWRRRRAADGSALEGSQLIAVNDALGLLQRRTSAVHAPVAAEIARESRPELGGDGLSKQQGFRNPAVLIAATTGTSTGDAVRLVKVGEATAPRTTLTGEAAPARHPHVAAAPQSGRIGMQPHPRSSPCSTASPFAPIGMRSTPPKRCCLSRPSGLSLDQLAKLIVRAEAHLDPDGLEPKERDARGDRSCVMFERDGMLHFNGKCDVETGAPIKIAIEAIVTAEFRAASTTRIGDPDADLRLGFRSGRPTRSR